MTFAGKQFNLDPENSPEVMSTYFQKLFECSWGFEMSDELNKFCKLLGSEKNEVGAGLDAYKIFKKEMKDKLKENSLSKEDRQIWKRKYLFSTELNPPIPKQVHQDMNAPLSHYFIHTSLNSYFTGNLVFGKYSDEPIKAALQQGVRVIELDLSPCGKDGICVRPRWGMQNTLELKKCLDSIKDHAFTLTRKYPLIITFKDDLKPDLQSKATKMITMTFGDMVYDSSGELPSPEQLHNRILISRRPPKQFLYADEAVKKVDVRDEAETGHESTDQDYQSLVTFHAVEPRGKLQEALTDRAKKVQRPDWYETGVISFTQTKFLRTRLKRKHLIGAPFKPQRAWMHGAQLIAQSRQEAKKTLWLMQGMFRANGGCGFVKKPDSLLNVSSSSQVREKKTLKVKVYMGDGWSEDFKDRFSKPDLYVTISIAGVPKDEKIVHTAVKNNEWKPEWGEEFEFKLTNSDLALLSIQVSDKDLTADGFGGQTCLRVSELIEGIRAVPLYDENGMQYEHTMLLMRFRLSES